MKIQFLEEKILSEEAHMVAADMIFRYQDLVKEKHSYSNLQTLGVLPEANYIKRSRVKQGHLGLTARFRHMSWEEVYSIVCDNLGEDQREALDCFKPVFNAIEGESKLAKPFEGWLSDKVESDCVDAVAVYEYQLKLNWGYNIRSNVSVAVSTIFIAKQNLKNEQCSK
ncbi:hypothetical protein MIR68_008758 [Amoeboaphelidium protococcarum]|nr:hypothetical protein MIR68_008758 [Amoeboaphelidium protococcarum]